MTKVLVRWRPWCLLAVGVLASQAWAQPPAVSATCPRTASELYTRLGSIPLDTRRVFHVRDATIDRPSLHIDLDDGTLAFTEDVCGRITGAYFEGEGEARLRPPNRVERASMALFTGMAILEEQFTSAYLRFNDDTASDLRAYLSVADDEPDFVPRAQTASQALASLDTLRLLLDFSHFLPSSQGTDDPNPSLPRLLHAHLLGRQLGAFEVYWDAAIPEPIWAGQVRRNGEIPFFDIWTSFAPESLRQEAPAPAANDISVSAFRIRATVQPPMRLQASADLDVAIRNGGERTLMLELSRYLKVDHAENNGRPLDFIQNQAIEGSQLQRRGNDLVALIFPAPLTKGQQLKLHFEYAGDVLSEAGSGLLYVGERGTWYPNFGLTPAQFDLEFHYPAAWTLVATGKRVSPETNDSSPGDAEKISHWISDRPIPVAGFNLGRYIGAEAKSGSVQVEAYGTRGVERSFPRPPMQVLVPPKTRPTVEGPGTISMGPVVVAPSAPPSPAHNAQAVADQAAKAVTAFSDWFGPYPYTSLAFTQMPGDLSQGWPGLVFLSTYAFLSPQEQADLKLDPVSRALDSQVLVHETAHQWWGDLVLWKSYRDQWLMEGLANYSSLMLLEQQNPSMFREVLDKYRNDLLSKNEHEEPLREAGPVTLGQRLISSHFPRGYEAISYERGTWLFHMLRSMLRDCDTSSRPRGRQASADEPFFRALRRVRERYAGKSLTTQEFFKVFEEELPRPLWYEKRHNFDWFVDGWVNGTAIPTLGTRDIRITPKEQSAIATGVIVQRDAPEDLVTAVPVYAQTTAKSLVYIGEVLADGAETTFRLSAPKETRKIVLDPNRTVLTTLK